MHKIYSQSRRNRASNAMTDSHPAKSHFSRVKLEEDYVHPVFDYRAPYYSTLPVNTDDVEVEDRDEGMQDYGEGFSVQKKSSKSSKTKHSSSSSYRKMTTRDMKYVPVERDDMFADRLSRSLETLPSDSSLAARYTAGVMLKNSDEIFKGGSYVLAPGLSRCPDVVHEIWPSAGVIYLGQSNNLFFKFTNDDDVEVIISLEKFPTDSSFCDNLLDVLDRNRFYWSDEPVVVTFNAATSFLTSSGFEKKPIQFTSAETGPFTTAIFYGGQTQGGPAGVFSRMKPLFDFMTSYDDPAVRPVVYCPYDVMVSIYMKEMHYRHQ